MTNEEVFSSGKLPTNLGRLPTHSPANAWPVGTISGHIGSHGQLLISALLRNHAARPSNSDSRMAVMNKSGLRTTTPNTSTNTPVSSDHDLNAKPGVIRAPVIVRIDGQRAAFSQGLLQAVQQLTRSPKKTLEIQPHVS